MREGERLVVVKIVKTVFERDDFRIFGCVLLEAHELVEVNKYGGFTIKGNLSYLTEGLEYKMIIKENPVDKFGMSYSVVSVPSLTEMDTTDFNEQQEIAILSEVTESLDIVQSIHKAYPNFCSMVLEGKAEEIDVKNIYNVGDVRKELYITKINLKFKFLLLLSRFPMYNLSNEECKSIVKKYDTLEESIHVLDQYPYKVLIGVLKRSFKRQDPVILELYPDLVESDQRTEALIVHLLNDNEYHSHTKVDGNALAEEAMDIAPECIKNMKQVATDSKLIYSEDYTYIDENGEEVKSVWLSKMDTYLAECLIAHTILDRTKAHKNNNNALGIDWKYYQDKGEYPLTDEQCEILRMANEESVMILSGGAGCVDCDTEFFNGQEWKKISNYKQGEQVLQYDLQTRQGTLTYPTKYHKYKSDHLWHFETQYGLDQTICDEHRVIYQTPKGVIKEDNILSIKEKVEQSKFRGKFLTTFNYNGIGIDLTDNEIKLMCAIICDGTFSNEINNICRFHIKKDRKKENLRQLFTECKIYWKEKESTAIGYTDFYIEAPRREKEFTSYWYNCNQHQLQIICDNIIQWDGNINYTDNNIQRQRFSSNNKVTTDFVQFAFSAIGKRATIAIGNRMGQKYKTNEKIYIRKSIDYDVIISNNNLCGLTSDSRKDHVNTSIEKVPTKDGYKYCFSVDTGALILRRNNKIFITGNCGKTCSVKTLITMLEDNNLTYKLLSPTGRASKVLSQSTGRKASTIHRALGSEFGWTDFVIIDEFSMCAVDVLAMLFPKLDPQTKLIFVCDEAQLPSVGCGNVLQDIINSGLVPKATLTKVFRYGEGSIDTVATNIRNGVNYLDNNGNSIFENKTKNKDYEFRPINKGDEAEQALEVYTQLKNKFSRDDIIILSPQRTGDCGTYAINNLIQNNFNPLNPNGTQVVYEKTKTVLINFRVGDRVLNTVNMYDVTTEDKFNMMNSKNNDFDSVNDDEFQNTIAKTKREVNVFNGDIGIIRRIDKEKNLFIQFDEEIIVFNSSSMRNLLLAYCVTIHKYQGSASRAVITIVSPKHKHMLSRNLIYVANTRAREKLIEIGDAETINNALPIQVNHSRETFLFDLLIKFNKERLEQDNGDSGEIT